MILIVQCVILLIVGGAQIFLRSFLAKVVKLAYGVAIIFFVFQSSLVSILQYQAWKNGAIGNLLLPPHESIGYFLQYIGWRFWSPVAVAFLFSVFSIYLMRRVNHKYDNRFLEEEEPSLAGLSMFVSGYPAILIYPVVFLIVFLCATTSTSVLNGKNFRLSPYYLWIPSSLLVILIRTVWFPQFPLWNLLII